MKEYLKPTPLSINEQIKLTRNIMVDIIIDCIKDYISDNEELKIIEGAIKERRRVEKWEES